jgi:ribonuclease VapC
MFLDSSVFIAILAKEEDAGHLATRIDQAPHRVTSALVLLETVMRLTTKLSIAPLDVDVAVRAFLREARVDVVPITDEEAKIAVVAFSEYGKGRGHPAQLNLADCLSYACAKSRNMPLLYKGADFARTDLA